MAVVYNEQDWLAYNASIRAQYLEANRTPDDAYPIWGDRAVFDYASGALPFAASCAKHLRECRAALGLPPIVPPVGVVPRLKASGTLFINQDTGALWKWRGVSAFRLFDEYLQGHDISGYCEWARSNTFNLVRVFGMYCGALGRLVPQEQPGYYDALLPFVQAVHRYGLSVEWTMFADMQTDPLKTLDVHSHYHQVCERFAGEPGMVCEICNEPFKNGLDPMTVYTPYNELPQATGLYVPENGHLPHAEYLTLHTPRDDEWPRKAKDVLELTRLGWGANEWGPAFPPLQIPGICDEPMGIGVEQAGRRSMNRADMAAYHGLGALFGAGSTVHSDFGIECRLPTDAEQAVVDAITLTWPAVTPEAQLWTYTAGHFGDCPLVNNGLRTYGMVEGSRAVMVRVRPTEAPVAQNGWHIVSQEGYQGCVVKLER